VTNAGDERAATGWERSAESTRTTDERAATGWERSAESTRTPDINIQPQTAAARMEQVLHEMQRVVVGQQRTLERVLVALLANGHCLLEGVPGIGKTLTVSTLAKTLGGSFTRLQFTPDLVPSDLIGTRVYRPSSERFDVELGPVFVNFVLADEINRAPAKVQSALLEVMGERQVSIGGTTYQVPNPFLVLATQNPIESEGVYPLPEAQRDRFLMRVPVDYPTDAEEHEIVARAARPPATPARLLSTDDVVVLQQAAAAVHVDPAVADYAVRLVLATRRPADAGLHQVDGLLAYGASPRASLGLVAAARALALLRGRPYVLPQDIYDVAYDVLNHRLVLSFEALADGITVDDVLVEVLREIKAPRVVPATLAADAAPGNAA
jgi:MoxR-like ATPase